MRKNGLDMYVHVLSHWKMHTINLIYLSSYVREFICHFQERAVNVQNTN